MYPSTVLITNTCAEEKPSLITEYQYNNFIKVKRLKKNETTLKSLYNQAFISLLSTNYNRNIMWLQKRF